MGRWVRLPTTDYRLGRARAGVDDLIAAMAERVAPRLEVALLVGADLELREAGVGEDALDVRVGDGGNAGGELLAPGFRNDRVLEGRSLERQRAHAHEACRAVLPH